MTKTKKQLLCIVIGLMPLSFVACKKAAVKPIVDSSLEVSSIKSEDGTAILGGSVAPTASMGAIGDFYLDKTTATFYGPKTTSGWPGGFSLTGIATSSTGVSSTGTTSGGVILSGKTAPDLSIGKVGDFYFDTSNKNFYGPKTAESWDMPVSLSGSTSDGAKMFILRDQVISEAVIKSWITTTREKIRNDRTKLESQKTQLKKDYDALVDSINSSSATEEEKQNQLSDAKSNYESSLSDLENKIRSLDERSSKSDDDLVIDVQEHFVEIPIGAKYQKYYDEGLSLCHISNSNGSWSDTEIDFYRQQDGYNYCYMLPRIKKDKLVIEIGTSPETISLIRTIKYDIRVIFIPTTIISSLSSHKIDIKDAQAVQNYLNLKN